MSKTILSLTNNKKFNTLLATKYSLIEVSDIKEILAKIKKNTPKLIILDFNIFNSSKSYIYETLNLHPAFIYIPIVLVLEDDKLSNRHKAFSYTLVSGILSYDETDQTLEKLQNILSVTVPYAGTIKHTALTALIHYESHIEHSNSVSALAHWLCMAEGLTNDEQYDTLFALNLSIIKHKRNKVLHYIKSFLNKDDSVYLLLKNFNSPKNIQGKIIIASLLVEEKLHSFVKSVELEKIGIDLINKAKEAYKKKNTYVYDRRRLNSFIDQSTHFLYEQNDITLTVLDEFITLLVSILERSLAIRGGAIAQIGESNENEISFYISPYSCTEKETRTCISEMIIKNSEISMDFSILNNLSSVKIYIQKNKAKEAINNEKNLERELLHSTLHRGSHFENATKYIEDLGGLDSIASALYEIEEIKENLNLLLIKTFNNPQALSDLSALLDSYAKVIHNNFYEFEAISIGLINLANTLEEKSKHVEDDFSYENIQHLIELLVSDLETWYDTIFVNHSVDHIHYLDSSLLSSSIQIQSQINNVISEEEDDNDLELF